MMVLAGLDLSLIQLNRTSVRAPIAALCVSAPHVSPTQQVDRLATILLMTLGHDQGFCDDCLKPALLEGPNEPDQPPRTSAIDTSESPIATIKRPTRHGRPDCLPKV